MKKISDIKNTDPFLISGGIVSIIGTVFFITGICLLIVSAVRYSGGERVTAVIRSIERIEMATDTEYNVYVDYEYNGEEFTDVCLGYYSSSMYQGKEINIYVDSDNPYSISSPYILLIIGGIFGGIGLILMFVGGFFLMRFINKKLLRKKLISDGHYVNAVFDSVEQASFTVNNNPVYIIHCTYCNPTDGKIYSFRSEYFNYNPSPAIDKNTPLKVYVDADDFSKNYVDVSGIKEKYILC
jgi:hypothetical protein